MALFRFRNEYTGVEKEISAPSREEAERVVSRLCPSAFFSLVWTNCPDYVDAQAFWEGLSTEGKAPSCSPKRFVDSL